MLRHCAYIVTFVPSVLRWRLAETKPGARRTETSVASVRSSTSRRWFAGSAVNMLIRVITSLFAEIVVIVSFPSEGGRDKAGATLLPRSCERMEEERERGYDGGGKRDRARSE